MNATIKNKMMLLIHRIMEKLNQSQLLKREGWSIKTIYKYYGYPERTEENPHGYVNRRMKLFSIDKIREIERLPEFQENIKRKNKKKRERILRRQEEIMKRLR